MSELGQRRRSQYVRNESACPPIAAGEQTLRLVGSVPLPDMPWLWEARLGNARPHPPAFRLAGVPGWSMGRVCVVVAWMLPLLPGAAWAQARPAAVELPTIEVVGVALVSGSEIGRDKVPANVEAMEAPALDHAKSPDLFQATIRALSGVSSSDLSGNPFQMNLDYRGFTAFPVQGTPQGLAVYQNGARINEAWGDVVSFLLSRSLLGGRCRSLEWAPALCLSRYLRSLRAVVARAQVNSVMATGI